MTFLPKTTATAHQHTLRKAFKKDQGVPSNERYDKGDRYILLWICTKKGCKYSYAYDLVTNKPN